MGCSATAPIEGRPDHPRRSPSPFLSHWLNSGRSPATRQRDPNRVKLGCLRIGGGLYQSCAIAVGMLIAEHPRTDPGVRDSRTGLPPWVFDGEAFARPRIKDSGLRQELPCKLSYPFPCRPVSLTPALERSSPKIHNIVPEGTQSFAVCRHSMIREVSPYDLSQPLTL